MKMKRKMLSMLLAVTMCLNMLPSTLYAEDASQVVIETEDTSQIATGTDDVSETLTTTDSAVSSESESQTTVNTDSQSEASAQTQSGSEDTAKSETEASTAADSETGDQTEIQSNSDSGLDSVTSLYSDSQTETKDQDSESEAASETEADTELSTECNSSNGICTHGYENVDNCPICTVQTMIDDLPAVDNLKVMNTEELNEVYMLAQDACDAYDALSEEEQEQVDDAKLDEVFEYFNGLTMTLEETVTWKQFTSTVAQSTLSSSSYSSYYYFLSTLSYRDGYSTVIPAGYTVNLDFNGYGISSYSSMSASILIENGGTLILTNAYDGAYKNGTGGSIAKETLTITNAGTFLINVPLTLSSPLVNSGTVTMNSSVTVNSVITNTGVLNINATPSFGSSGVIQHNGGTLIIGSSVNSVNVSLAEGQVVSVSSGFSGKLNLTLSDAALAEIEQGNSVTVVKAVDDSVDLESILDNIVITNGTLCELALDSNGNAVVQKMTAGTAVYIDGVSGDDDNEGTSADKPVKTFAKAKEVLGQLTKLATDNGTELPKSIYVLNTITVDSDETWDLSDYPDVKIVRDISGSFADTMIKVAGASASLILTGVRIDGLGNKGLASSNSLVTVENSATLTINSGTQITGGISTADNGGAVYVSSAAVIMNGGSISGNSAEYGGGVFLTGKSEFTFNGGSITDNSAGDEGGGVYIDGESEFIICGGSVDANASGTYGGGILLNAGTLTITDGSVSENAGTYGAGVYCYAGKLDLQGGTIASNTGSSSGGGVYLAGSTTFTMTGGSISDNTSGSSGGGVYHISSTEFIMSGGSITGNTSGSSGGGVYISSGRKMTINGDASVDTNTTTSGGGGGIYLNSASSSKAVLTMENGSISNNESSGSGGGVYLYNYASFEMKNGVIENNTAKNSTSSSTSTNVGGGGVYMSSTSTSFKMYDGFIKGNTAKNGGGVFITSSTTEILKPSFEMSGGTITNNTATLYGGGVYVYNAYPTSKAYANSIILSGIPVIIGNTVNGSANNVYLHGNKSGSTYYLSQIILDSSLGKGAEVGVTMYTSTNLKAPSGDSTVQITTTESATSYYSSSVNKFVSDNSSYCVVTETDSTGSYLVLAVASARASVTANGVTTSYTTIDEAFNEANAAANGTATVKLLTNCDTTGVTVASGSNITLDLNGYKLTGNLNSNNSVITVNGSLTITDNSADQDGQITGGVGTLLADDTRIGGAVYVGANASLALTSGTITGNSATYGGAVYVAASGSISVCGNPVVTGNTSASDGSENNVYLQAGQTITLASELTKGAEIGITTAADPSAASVQITAKETGSAYYNTAVHYFISDVDGYSVEINGDDDTGHYLSFASTVASVTVNGTTILYTKISDAFTYANEESSASAAAVVTLLADCTASVSLEVAEQKTITLDLNGHTLTGSGSGSVLVVNGSLTVQDSNDNASAAGQITGGTGTVKSGAGSDTSTYGGGIYVSSSGSVAMISGTIAGNTATYGGGVYLDGGTFTMTGGTVTENAASAVGGGIHLGTGTFKISDSPVISDNAAAGASANNVYLPSGKTMTLDGNLAAGAVVRVSTEDSVANQGLSVPVTSLETKTDYYQAAKEFISSDTSGNDILIETTEDGTHLVLAVENSVAMVTDASGNRSYYTGIDDAFTYANSLTGEAVITIIKDCTANGTLTVNSGSDMILDLNGCTLTGMTSGSVIKVNGTLTVKDSSDDMTGSITGGTGTTVADKTFGGGVYVADGGAFTLSSGTITENSADYGGGVYVGGGTFTINGGAITGNTAAVNGGGVYFESGTINLSGSVSITDNIVSDTQNTGVSTTENNVYLCTDQKLTLTGTVSGTVGITTQADPKEDSVVITVQEDISGAGAASYYKGSLGAFEADNTSYIIVSQTDTAAETGCLILAVGEVASVVDNTVLDGTPVTYSTIDAAFAAANALDDATVTLLVNCASANALVVEEGQAITLDLNGYRLRGKSGATVTVNGTFELTDSSTEGRITSSDTTEGIGVYVAEGAQFNMTGGMISDIATENGTGVYVNGGSFSMSGGTISGISASGDGAAVYLADGEAVLSGGSITGNTAVGNGGAVYAADGSLTISGSVLISENKAANGGAVYVGDAAVSVTVDGGSISENEAEFGGGIYAADGTLILKDGEISGNKAETGAGLYLNDGEVTLERATISGNTASVNGGGVYMADGTLTLTEGSISENEAETGAGIYVSGGTVALNGGDISGNAASGNGGGIYAAGGTVALNGAAISGNTATENGGGVYVMDGADVSVLEGTVVSENKANYGGGIFVYGGNFTMSGGTIDGNEGSARGGGLYLADPTRDNTENPNTEPLISGVYTITGGTISNNTTSIDGTDYDISKLDYYGGAGIYLDHLTVSLSGLTVCDNTSVDSGGGIYLNESVLNATDLTVSGNKTTASLTHGGGIFLTNTTSVLNLQDSTVSGNSAASNGGGISAYRFKSQDSNEMEIHLTGSCEISGNSAYRGGGIYASVNTFTAEGIADSEVLISNNTATANEYPAAAGITISAGDEVSLKYVVISENKAENGCVGGLGVSACSSFSAENCEITNNESTSTGYSGAYLIFALAGAPATFTDCTISGNKNGQSVLYLGIKGADVNTSHSLFTNCTISDNENAAGGSTITIPYNNNSLYIVSEFDSCRISGNSGGDVGAIKVYENSYSKVILKDTVVTGNTGVRTGGVLGTLEMTGGALYNNTATDGNGANDWMVKRSYLSSGTINVSVTSSVLQASLMSDSLDSSVDFGDCVWIDSYNGFQMETALDSTTVTESTVTAHGGVYPVQSTDYYYFTAGNFIRYVAEITDNSGKATRYTSLTDAISAAASGDTIKLIAGAYDSGSRILTESVTIPSGKTVTIDMNGCTLRGAGAEAITIESGAGLTITDSQADSGTPGTISTSDFLVNYAIRNYGALTIDAPVTVSPGLWHEGTELNLLSDCGVQYVHLAKGCVITASSDYNPASLRLEIDSDLAEMLNTRGNTETVSLIVPFDPAEGLAVDLADRIVITGAGVLVEIAGIGENGTMIARTIVTSGVYLDGVNGDDANNGTTYETPVKTFERAKEVLDEVVSANAAANQNTEEIQGIYIIGTVTVRDTATWTLSELSDYKLMRYPSFSGTLIQVSGSGAALTLEEITIDGMKASAKGSLVQVNSGASLSVTDGAVLKNNTYSETSSGTVYAYGGAVYCSGTFNMDGGKIIGNTAYNGGGVVVSGSSAVFNLSGGEISGNTATNFGGGAAVFSNAVMNFTGGTIADNTAANGGGGIAVGESTANVGTSTTLNMAVSAGQSSKTSRASASATGGTISGNVSGAQGGGIYIQCECTANISAGTITGNTSQSGVFGGGGIYVNGERNIDGTTYATGTLNLSNVLIQGNTAAVLGGGIAGCSTSVVKIYRENGAAILDNEAGSKGDQISLGEVQYGGVNEAYYVSEFAADGTAYNWTNQDGASVSANGLQNQTSVLYLEDSSITSASLTGWTPSVVISNNTAAVSGGGIGSNGYVTIGNPGGMTISVTKKWVDGDNEKNTRPASVVIRLLRATSVTNALTGTTATTEAVEVARLKFSADASTGEWPETLTFTDLPETDPDGNAYIYSIKEEPFAISGTEYAYDDTKMEVMDDAAALAAGVDAGYVLTNVLVTDVSVSKVWDDNGDQDGVRPESVKVTLTGTAGADYVKTYEAALSKNTGWAYTFEGLPVYYGSKEISYTLTEAKVSKYSAKVETDASGYSFTVSNTHEPETTEIAVTKEWDDNNDQDGKRPASISVTLTGSVSTSSLSYSKTYVAALTAAGGWKYTFKNLPVYYKGEKISYTIAEDSVTGYNVGSGSPAISWNTNGTEVTITNRHVPETTDVTVTKNWVDAGAKSKRPASVSVTLTGSVDSGSIFYNEKYTQVIPQEEGDSWSYTFEDLPVYYSGQKITYSLVENKVDPAYEASIVKEDDGYSFTVTNTIKQETTSISGTKIWIDPADTKHPTITIELYRDGIKVDSVELEHGTTTYTFDNLDVYDLSDGHVYEYTIAEQEVDGYTSKVDGYTVTNTIKQEYITVSGAKTWDDADNQDDARPESITIRLWKAGSETALDTRTVTEEDHWSWSFENLPKYAEDGSVIGYSVTEDAVSGYAVSYDGFNVTNAHTPSKTSVTVRKSWDDSNDQDGLRPKNVTIELLKNGEATGETVTLNEGNGWTSAFTELDEYENRQKVSYTVRETGILSGDYQETITGDAATAFVITNTHVPETTDVTVTKIWVDGDDADGRPASVSVTLTGRVDSGNISYLQEYTQEISKGTDGSWSCKFESLPVYYKGQKITYSLKENHVDSGYDASVVKGDDGYSFTVTNTLIQEEPQEEEPQEEEPQEEEP
ncbi:MAG: Cna B-type domain-containing protein, partial [Lachnospiraceae bacterium]|nr:Cna B-type domain-containing protein [Lachnospiraceae bacterium]